MVNFNFPWVENKALKINFLVALAGWDGDFLYNFCYLNLKYVAKLV